MLEVHTRHKKHDITALQVSNEGEVYISHRALYIFTDNTRWYKVYNDKQYCSHCSYTEAAAPAAGSGAVPGEHDVWQSEVMSDVERRLCYRLAQVHVLVALEITCRDVLGDHGVVAAAVTRVCTLHLSVICLAVLLGPKLVPVLLANNGTAMLLRPVVVIMLLPYKVVPWLPTPEVVCVVMTAETVTRVLPSIAAPMFLVPEGGSLVCVQSWRHRLEQVWGWVGCGGSCLSDGRRRIWRGRETWGAWGTHRVWSANAAEWPWTCRARRAF